MHITLLCSFLACLLLGSPEEAALPTTTLALTGDVMLGRGVAQALDGDWEAAFAEVRPWLTGADLAFANLESPLTTAPQVSDGYDLRAPPEAVAALRAAGFGVVSLANNHALDAGRAGLRETVNTLSAAGIAPLVDKSNLARPGSPDPGQKRGFGNPLGAVLDLLNLPIYQSTNVPTYHLLAFDDSVAPLDLQVATEAVAAAAEQAAIVVVSIHWGGEYQAAPGPRQQAIARALADAGASVIVGHGPHVLQRVEWVGETLVAYSLGNFLFDQPYPADCRQGAILRLTLRGDRIVAIKAIPTVTERGCVRPAGPDDSAAILSRLHPPIYQPTNPPTYQSTDLP